MKKEEEKKNGRQVLVATKISSEAWLRLNDIASRIGLSPYRFLQEVIDTLILYMDEGRQLSPAMQQVIDCFEQFEGWGNLARISDINVNWRVLDAVYFLHDDRTNGLAGLAACWSKSGYFGTHDYTFNKAAMLDMMVRRLFPDLYRTLGILQMQADTSCVVETIRYCVQNMVDDEDKATIREMFADCGRTEYGRSTELVKYVRHNCKSIDTQRKASPTKAVQLDLFSTSEQSDI